MTGVSGEAHHQGIRADIQALRALAVLAVAFCHYFPVRAVGGFIGVDVFFVVSGFLITAHLLREIEATGRVQLGRFYARRARLLLPAAYLVLLASLLGTILLLPTSRWNDTAKEVFASAAYLQNWLLASKAADPLGAGASATVVRHYWSLSIEEQFYLVWPLLLMAGFAIALRFVRSGFARAGFARGGLARAGFAHDGFAHARFTQRAVLGGLLAGLGALSFCSEIIVSATELTVAYFVSYTRVWEFVVGGLLALAAPALHRLLLPRVLLRSLLQWAGLVMILWAIATFDTETAFPGPWAALPVFGTALVIAAGPETPRFTPMHIARVRPVQLLGDISYSIYLWHFPLFVLAPFALGRALGPWERLLLLTFSVGLAWLTARYVEQPGRTALFAWRASPAFFGVLGAAVVAFGLIALPIGRVGGMLAAKDRVALAERAQTDCFGAGAFDEGCGDPFAATDLLVVGPSEGPRFRALSCNRMGAAALIRCDFSAGDPEAQRVWLFGDAGVKNWKPALLRLAEQQGWVLTMAAKGGCSVLAAGGQDPPAEGARRCEDQHRLSAGDRPDLVVVAQDSEGARTALGEGELRRQDYEQRAARLVEEWTAAGARVAVIRDVPDTVSTSTLECLEIHESSPLDCSVSRSAALPGDPFAAAVEALDRTDAQVVDLTDAFCDEQRCYALIGGLPVHFDDRHLARSYSQTLAPRMLDELAPLLAPTEPVDV